jgi:hypothetical protein
MVSRYHPSIQLHEAERHRLPEAVVGNWCKSFVREMKSRWMMCPEYKPPFIGCTEEEVESIRLAQGVDYLPELYRQFMLEMGKSTAGLIPANDPCDLSFPEVLSFQNDGLPEDCFVFLVDSQGDMFWFFRTVDNYDNPMLYAVAFDNFDPERKQYYPDKIAPLFRLSEYLAGWGEECMDDDQFENMTT